MMIARHITKDFRTDNDAGFLLSDVSLSLPAGALVAILGPNGAGKSTFLRLMAGDLNADVGETVVQAGGKEHRLPGYDPQFRPLLLHQESRRDIVPSMTVAENLLLAEIRSKVGSLRFARQKASRDRAVAVLARVPMGLQGKMDRQASTLSGGEKQGLVLARALLCPTRVFLLDEFVSSLTTELAFKTLAVLKEVVRERRGYCAFVTHHLDLAFEFADYLVFLHNGRALTERVENAPDSQEEVIRLFATCLREATSHV